MEQHKSKLSRFYFWLFILLVIMSAFLFWSAQGNLSKDSSFGTMHIAAIVTTLLAVFIGIVCFVRFIRSRSIAGGLFLTTSVSTAVFLGTSQLVAAIIPPTAAAFSGSPEATNAGITTVVGLAQIGLFALWFLFLLLTIYLQVRPVKRIDKVLARLLEGEEIKRVRIGKARQYRGIEQKIAEISSRGIRPKPKRKRAPKQCPPPTK